jgi:putative hydrolase of the HAD superfamily
MNNEVQAAPGTPPAAVLFDFGGVLADEGFYQGLLAIGRGQGLDPELFFRTADTLIYETGYLVGQASEEAYWQALREETGIRGSDSEFRAGILKRFVMRPAMLRHVDRLRAEGSIVAILSDQTNWLDELDRMNGIFRHFDAVYNSFWIHRSKRDPAVFPEICAALAAAPGRTLFIDDNAGHIRRAAEQGLRTILFTTVEAFEAELPVFFPRISTGNDRTDEAC